MHMPATRTPYDRLSGSLVELMKQGEYAPTALFASFQARLAEKTGIRIYFVDTGGPAYLWLNIDSISYKTLQASTPPTVTVLDCLREAADAVGCPPPHVQYIRYCDFFHEARNTYFYVYVPLIDSEVRKAIPGAYMLRWRHADEKHYYIIYDTPKRLAKETKRGTTAAISSFVHTYLQTHDPLGLFADYTEEPVVTDKQTLRDAGEIMGIMRNNPGMGW